MLWHGFAAVCRPVLFIIKSSVEKARAEYTPTAGPIPLSLPSLATLDSIGRRTRASDERACLKNFIAALGAKYDGDARIGFITAGLLGHWGEWHTYQREDLWAGKDVQIEVMDAYEAAFKRSPVLLFLSAGLLGVAVSGSAALDAQPGASRKSSTRNRAFFMCSSPKCICFCSRWSVQQPGARRRRLTSLCLFQIHEVSSPRLMS